MSNHVQLTAIEVDGQMTILPDANFTSYGSRINPPSHHQAKPTPAILPTEKTAGYDWAPWGQNDCLPTTIREKLYSVPMATRAVYQLTQMMYGNGLMYYRNSELKDGPQVTRAYIPEIEQFLRQNRILTHWLPAQLIEYRFYMNCFNDIVFNRARNMVTGLFHKKAEFSRLSLQNEKTGHSDYLYYSPRFSDGMRPKEDEIQKVQLFDWVNEAQYLDNMQGYKMAWHSYFPTPGTEYYAKPLWLGLFEKDGWLDVSAAVPKIVSSMQHNQIVLKYHILIPESYFEIRYRDWQTYTDKQRNAKIDALIKQFNDNLRGTDNLYMSISTVFRQDHNTMEPIGKVEIIPIDDKIKSDAWVPSSDKSDAQIVQGLGLHPSQVGLQPQGGKMGAGSGSDQRESFNTGISLNTLDQIIVLEPLNWLARFNAQTNPNWDVTFIVDHTMHTTTNLQESGLQPSSNTVQIK